MDGPASSMCPVPGTSSRTVICNPFSRCALFCRTLERLDCLPVGFFTRMPAVARQGVSACFTLTAIPFFFNLPVRTGAVLRLVPGHPGTSHNPHPWRSCCPPTLARRSKSACSSPSPRTVSDPLLILASPFYHRVSACRAGWCQRRDDFRKWCRRAPGVLARRHVPVVADVDLGGDRDLHL